jgi:hypothetical protein
LEIFFLTEYLTSKKIKKYMSVMNLTGFEVFKIKSSFFSLIIWCWYKYVKKKCRLLLLNSDILEWQTRIGWNQLLPYTCRNWTTEQNSKIENLNSFVFWLVLSKEMDIKIVNTILRLCAEQQTCLFEVPVLCDYCLEQNLCTNSKYVLASIKNYMEIFKISRDRTRIEFFMPVCIWEKMFFFNFIFFSFFFQVWNLSK